MLLIGYGLLHQTYVLGWPSTTTWLGAIDADIYIRLTKVKELIQGGSLYDHAIIATNAPYGGVTTPWTRPLDFILVALYQFTPSDFTIEKRLLLTANWYPLIIVMLITYFLTKAAETGFKSLQKFSIVILCLIGGLLFGEQTYFMAGNADHHSLQALLWCVTIWLILGKPSRASATYLGLTMGLWFWISPEALPFIFTVYAILGIKAVLKPSEMYHPTLASITLTLVTLLALFIEYPADQVLATRAYDSISIVYVILFSFCAMGFMALQYIIVHLPTVKARFTASAITATAISALYICLFPKFLKGPMADVDPYILTNFLPRVSEAMPLLKLDGSIILSSLYLAIPALFLSLRFIKKSPMLFAFLAVPFVMNVFQHRWAFYLEISSIIIIAKCLPTYARGLARKYRNLSLVLHLYALMAALGLIVYGISVLLPPSKSLPYAYISQCQFETFQLVQSGELVNVLGTAPLTIESNALGNSGIPFFTPYHYVAGYYHRESQGLKVKDAIFDAKTLPAVRPLLKDRDVKALLVCPTSYPSWTNDYFTDNPPKLDWVKINTALTFRKDTGITTHPVLLMIEP